MESFDVRENEIFGIIGPAQSGKTTLLKIINRTLNSPRPCMGGLRRWMTGCEPHQGRVRISPARRHGGTFAGRVTLSIYDNVAFAPRSFGMKDGEELDGLVQKCLEQAALWDEVKDRLDSLGTKPRAANSSG